MIPENKDIEIVDGISLFEQLKEQKDILNDIETKMSALNEKKRECYKNINSIKEKIKKTIKIGQIYRTKNKTFIKVIKKNIKLTKDIVVISNDWYGGYIEVTDGVGTWSMGVDDFSNMVGVINTKDET